MFNEQHYKKILKEGDGHWPPAPPLKLVIYSPKIHMLASGQGCPLGGRTGESCPGRQPERGPRRLHEYLFKRSIYSNRAVTIFFRDVVWHAYKLGDTVGEGELLSLSACNDLFFWSSTYSLGKVVIQNGNLLAFECPTLNFSLGPLISLGGPGWLNNIVYHLFCKSYCITITVYSVNFRKISRDFYISRN